MENTKLWKLSLSHPEHDEWMKDQSFFLSNDEFQEMTRNETFSDLIAGSDASALSVSIWEEEN